MFETIGLLFSIGFWAVAIFMCLCGIVVCFDNLFSGSGWKAFWAGFALLFGIFSFFCVYALFDSIAFSIMATGFILVFIGNAGSDEATKTAPKKEDYDLGDAIIDTYCEYELVKAAVKDAIQESEHEM